MSYKEMYLELFRATEQAINTLIDAQRRCEEMYMNQDSSIIPFPVEKNESQSDT
jgi:hypothetical protein